jgi:hypothetical protein
MTGGSEGRAEITWVGARGYVDAEDCITSYMYLYKTVEVMLWFAVRPTERIDGLYGVRIFECYQQWHCEPGRGSPQVLSKKDITDSFIEYFDINSLYPRSDLKIDSDRIIVDIWQWEHLRAP